MTATSVAECLGLPKPAEDCAIGGGPHNFAQFGFSRRKIESFVESRDEGHFLLNGSSRCRPESPNIVPPVDIPLRGLELPLS